MSDIGSVLSALGDEVRRGVVEALADGPHTAGELADEVGVTPAALSRHLRVLREAGVVRAGLDGADQRRHVYQLRPEALYGLRDWAEGVAAFWDRQLTAFADHADHARPERHGRPG